MSITKRRPFCLSLNVLKKKKAIANDAFPALCDSWCGGYPGFFFFVFFIVTQLFEGEACLWIFVSLLNNQNMEVVEIHPDRRHDHLIRVNSLAPGEFEWNFRYMIFKQISVIDCWGIIFEIALI